MKFYKYLASLTWHLFIAIANVAALSFFADSALAFDLGNSTGAFGWTTITVNCGGNGNCDGNNNVGSGNGNQNGNSNLSVSNSTFTNGTRPRGAITIIDCSGNGNCDGNNNTGNNNGSLNGNDNITVSSAGNVTVISGGTNPTDVTTLNDTNAGVVVQNGAIIQRGLTVTGGENVAGLFTADSGIQANSSVQIGNTSSGITLNTNGSATFNGPVTENNGATVANGLTVTSGGVNVTGNSKIAGALNVEGNTTVSNLSVRSGSEVSMGGNAVHDVGAPVLPDDAANKAYVDGGLSNANQRIDKANEGVALALAISQPIILPNQDFAFRAGWGNFEGENAIGFSVAGVTGRNVLEYGSTMVLDGGIGFGTDRSTVAGKAGVTFGFGSGLPSIR